MKLNEFKRKKYIVLLNFTLFDGNKLLFLCLPCRAKLLPQNLQT